MAHAMIWVQLEDIMLSEIDQSHTQILYDSGYMNEVPRITN
jgi:hypothetical protein